MLICNALQSNVPLLGGDNVPHRDKLTDYLTDKKITCTDKMEDNSPIAIIQHIPHAQNGIYLKENPPLISGKLTKTFFSLRNFRWNTTNIGWNLHNLHALVDCRTLLFGQFFVG